jgi:hypothetical protein
MANLVDNPSYTPNEVLTLDATTPVEGAHDGAAYGGIGPDNQPHQQLANRTAHLKQQIQELRAEFWGYLWPALTGVIGGLSALPADGFLHIPVVNLATPGSQNLFVQWGMFEATLGAGAHTLLSIPLDQDAQHHRAFSTFAPGLMWATVSPLLPDGPPALQPLSCSWSPSLSSRDMLRFHVQNLTPSPSGVTAFLWFAIGTV